MDQEIIHIIANLGCIRDSDAHSGVNIKVNRLQHFGGTTI